MNNQPIVRLRSLQVLRSLRVRLCSVRVRLCSQQVTAGKHPGSNNALMYGSPAHQSGALLIICLIMLLLLTLIGATASQVTSLEERMAGNMRDKNLAFQAAESALKAAEASLRPPAVLPTFDPSGIISPPSCIPSSNPLVNCAGFYTETSTIPTASAILTDSFWTTKPVATSTVTTATLGNGIVTPVYIIQRLLSACFYPVGCPPNPTSTPYRITVRATGGSTNAVVILQSIIY